MSRTDRRENWSFRELLSGRSTTKARVIAIKPSRQVMARSTSEVFANQTDPPTVKQPSEKTKTTSTRRK